MAAAFPHRPFQRWACLALVAGACALSVPDVAAAPAPRPRIGLVLSGGGARGAAHVGVLQVLERNRIPVDIVTGTSMGALVGGLYASGLSPSQLDSIVTSLDWAQTFADFIPRADRSFRRKRDDDLYLVKHKPGLRGGRLVFPPGILDGQRVDLLLKRLTLPVVAVRDFDDLRIPYRAMAADIVTGDGVVLDHGDLALAMRASMSIPAAFAPREIDGRLLVDGGVVDNMPIELARKLGADVIIAVDISTPAAGRDQLNSVIAISTQIVTLASEQNKARQIATLKTPDVLIRPQLGSITVASFERAAEAVEIGARATEAALDTLRPLALPPEAYQEYLAARAARDPRGGPPRVDEVRIVNHSRIGDDVLAARLDVPVGEPLDVDRLERGLEQVYGLELFQSVYYDVVPGPRGNVLTVTARERSWGPNYLQGGVAVFDDFEGPNFNLALAYSRTAVNRRNGEWRLGLQVGQEPAAWTGFYQPLDRALRAFVDVKAWAGEASINVFDAGGDKTSELGITRFGGSVAAGREIGTWAEARAGVLREGGRIAIQVGDPGRPESHYDTGELFAQFHVDKLDEVAFPHHGTSLLARFSAAREALGSATGYEQAVVEGAAYLTRGRYTGFVGGFGGMTLDDDAPFESLFRLGGLGRLSGLEQDELAGQQAVVLRAGFYRRIAGFQLLPVYAGLLAEYGNVYQRRTDVRPADGIAAGCVFLGADTILGPLCVAYGRAEGDRGNYYLTLGQPLGGRRPGFRPR